MARNEALRLRYKNEANNAVEKFTEALAKRLEDYVGGLAAKMERVLDVVEEHSQKLVPVDTGATKASFYREVIIEDDRIIARAGYDRENQLPYIVYIHEIPYNFKEVGAENRFLAKGFQRALLQIDRILAE